VKENIGQSERATQERANALFWDELGFLYLGEALALAIRANETIKHT
jgi:hypothetical protein